MLCIRQGLDRVSHLKMSITAIYFFDAKLQKNDIILSCGGGCELCFSPVNHKEFKEVNGIAVTKISISIYLNLQIQFPKFISIKHEVNPCFSQEETGVQRNTTN